MSDEESKRLRHCVPGSIRMKQKPRGKKSLASWTGALCGRGEGDAAGVIGWS